jgi:hypothetical protein
MPRWQHRAIWGYATWNRICGPISASILTVCSRWMLTSHGAAAAAAPCHLGFCSAEANLPSWPSTVVSRMSIACGDAAAAAPCDLGFCHFAGNPRLRSLRSPAGVGEGRPPLTVVPRWHHRPIWNFTESPRIGSSMQRAGPRRSTFHFAPRIERLQSFHPRKRKEVSNFLGGHPVGLSFSLDSLLVSPNSLISLCCSVVSSASTARVSARSASEPS